MTWFCRLPTTTPPADNTAGAFMAAILTIAAVFAIASALTWPTHRLAWLFLACFAFQVGHFFEHSVQMLGLVGTTDHVTVTGWARQFIWGYQQAWGGSQQAGIESLHWFGDLIYTAGLVAWARINPNRAGMAALTVQLAHQTEHAALLMTTAYLGEPVGLSTGFGAGPLWARIVAHFILNAVGTVLWILSVRQAQVAYRSAV